MAGVATGEAGGRARPTDESEDLMQMLMGGARAKPGETAPSARARAAGAAEREGASGTHEEEALLKMLRGGGGGGAKRTTGAGADDPGGATTGKVLGQEDLMALLD